MNIMVFDVPAEHGGALTILNEFYEEVVLHNNKNINWIFILSKPEFQETKNIKILKFPWVKKSWAHRLYFDQIVAPKLVREYKIDKIFSLQNIIVPHTKVNQILYVHQSLPFVNHRFTFKKNKKLWIYQNIIGRIIIKSIKKADKVIVQTNWFKKACIEKIGVRSDKIKVVTPKSNIQVKKFFKPTEKHLSTFFYPSNASTYKNHKLIIDACKMLQDNDIKEYKVIFTLKGNENKDIVKLYDEVKERRLPVEFIGNIKREVVFELYSKSVLLFPSYIETLGLPMLEARMHKSMILASDCIFSNEILWDYENVYFFNPFILEELVDLMKQLLSNKIQYRNIKPNLCMSNNIKTDRLIDLVV